MHSHLQEQFFLHRDDLNQGTWSFEIEEAGGILNPVPANTKPNRIVLQLDGIQVIRSDAASRYEATILRAERTWIIADTNTYFIIDRIKAESPVKVDSQFALNNTDSRLKVKAAAETKLVLRRNDAGMKFFLVSATSSGEENRGSLWLDCGDLRYSEPAEVTTSMFRYTSEWFRTKHTIVYAAARDDTEAVKHWHILPLTNRHFYVEPPAKYGGYSLELTQDEEFVIRNHTDGKNYRISHDDLTLL